MYEIVIISGKGGTGKTSVATSFAHLLDRGVICDLDVDAPDLHIILEPKNELHTEFISGYEAELSQETCSLCGLCYDKCKFGAVIKTHENSFKIDSLRCEGCGVCAELCPTKAIKLTEKKSGDWYYSKSRFGPFIHALLLPGQENSGRLVSLLKQKSREYAKKEKLDFILYDGSPGIGCPVISSISGADLVVAVVEPSPSGRHDFVRVADLCEHFGIPVVVLINKADINSSETQALKTFCKERKYKVIAELPFSHDVTMAMVKKRAITETESPLGKILISAWNEVKEIAFSKSKKINKL
ncbi:ATP-binding protein [Desulfovibrio litoralis]|uniref:MinD superfamily P-loop ATPase, contains an inserted ferredoxin domain n=1 Tax=Desulfovibrio litoralis DSM 11393 TaxID=1121455 RepID=A0A1M7RR42_9BACT|nr:ATP-binding protein [Desulfovibrio litoralis]SHN48562.1 MinD superfamily P-loop ATPase, contains an inserted ferredoxin domain [Desulfovibrio litoralis DSM 11393]